MAGFARGTAVGTPPLQEGGGRWRAGARGTAVGTPPLQGEGEGRW
jgi:hypothetical protein